MIKFLLSRYIAYGVIVLEILLIPILVLKDDYIKYEYLKNIINLSSFVLLGSHTGFVYYFYSKEKDYFPTLTKVSILVLLSSSIIYSLFYRNIYISLPILCFGISVFMEKKMQIQKDFYLAMLYKPLVALVLICTILLSLKISTYKLDILQLLAIGYTGALFIWILLIRLFSINTFNNIASLSFKYNISDFSLFFKMIRVGIIENAATVLLTLTLFIDRYTMNKFYPTELSSYSLAFNFSQLVFVGINSLAYVHNVEIGESFSKIDSFRIRKILISSLKIFAILFVGVLGISFFYQVFFKKFNDLLLYTAILSLLVGFFYVCNVVSVIPLYKGKQSTITSLIAVGCFLNICIAYLFHFIKLPIFLSVLKTGIILSLIGVSIVIYSVKLINVSKENE